MIKFGNINYQDLICTGISDIRNQELFTDVTIVSGDKLFPANRMVLGINSDYFKTILMKIDSPNPVIIIKDISPETMTSILHYMYNGEVILSEIEADIFLQGATFLKLKGFKPNQDLLNCNDTLKPTNRKKRKFDSSLPNSNSKLLNGSSTTFRSIKPIPNSNRYGNKVVRHSNKLATKVYLPPSSSRLQPSHSSVINEPLENDYDDIQNEYNTSVEYPSSSQNFSNINYQLLMPEVCLKISDESKNFNTASDSDSDIEIISDNVKSVTNSDVTVYVPASDDPVNGESNNTKAECTTDPLYVPKVDEENTPDNAINVLNSILNNASNFSKFNDDSNINHGIFSAENDLFEGFDACDSGPLKHLILLDGSK